MKNSPQDSLSRLLQEWKVDDDLAPRFKENVWRKIETTRKESAVVSPRLVDWFRLAFGRPAFASAYLIVLTCIGLGSGLYRASRENERLERSAKASYLQMVDPYQNGAPRQL